MCEQRTCAFQTNRGTMRSRWWSVLPRPTLIVETKSPSLSKTTELPRFKTWVDVIADVPTMSLPPVTLLCCKGACCEKKEEEKPKVRKLSPAPDPQDCTYRR